MLWAKNTIPTNELIIMRYEVIITDEVSVFFAECSVPLVLSVLLMSDLFSEKHYFAVTALL